MSSKVALIADLGGTNARFQLLRVDDQSPFSHIVLHSATYPTASSKNFPELVARFVAEAPEAPDVCACAVCGPIIDGAAYCASAVLAAPWQFDEAQVSEACGGCASVLLNDFVAVGHALPNIPAAKLHTLHAPEAKGSVGKEPVACLGPGTGLGNVYATWGEDSERTGVRKVLASEGSMSEFVPRTQLEWDFLCWVREREGNYVTVDRIVSGQGIASWYQFLKAKNSLVSGLRETPCPSDPSVDAAIAASDQPAGVIAAHGTPGPGSDPICVQAIDNFLDTLGAEAGNLALRFLARGGVYIAGGGIAGKLLSRIKDGRVLKAYLERGEASEIVQNCPLFVSDEDDMGLKGALAAARTLLVGRL